MAVKVGQNGELSTSCYKDFQSKEYSQVQFMRKVKGYDLFVLASKGNLTVVQLGDKEGISTVGP